MAGTGFLALVRRDRVGKLQVATRYAFVRSSHERCGSTRRHPSDSGFGSERHIALFTSALAVAVGNVVLTKRISHCLQVVAVAAGNQPTVRRADNFVLLLECSSVNFARKRSFWIAPIDFNVDVSLRWPNNAENLNVVG